MKANVSFSPTFIGFPFSSTIFFSILIDETNDISLSKLALNFVIAASIFPANVCAGISPTFISQSILVLVPITFPSSSVRFSVVSVLFVNVSLIVP